MPVTSLSNLERRVLANLSIPRNVTDLTSHLRPYETAPEADVDALLKGALTDNGWAVNLGQHDDPAKLASKVQKHKQAMELPDEKADIYSRRMLRPDLAWRLGGDLWMLTEDGLAELHRAPTTSTRPMTPSQVQAAVDAEWARTHTFEFEPGKTSLVERCCSSTSSTPGSSRSPRTASALERPPEAAAADGRRRVRLLGRLRGVADRRGEPEDRARRGRGPVVHGPVDPGVHGRRHRHDGGQRLAHPDLHRLRPQERRRDGHARRDVGRRVLGEHERDHLRGVHGGHEHDPGVRQLLASTVGTLRKWGDVASTVISTTQTPAQFAVGAYTTSTT
jgi:hypothetical protein